MNPELRAILDRYMYEHAGIRHLLQAAPPEADARPVAGSSWTAAQMVGHFAAVQSRYVTLLEAWLVGESPSTPALDPDSEAPEEDEWIASASREQILECYAGSLRSLFDVFHRLTDGQLESSLGSRPARHVLAAWSEHQLTHIFPLIDVLPETRYNPVIVNWLARVEVKSESAHQAQRKYIADVREYYAKLTEEVGDADD